jgi:hypothetical protein
VRGEFGARAVEREFEVREQVADRVRGEPDEDARCDAEAARFWRVADGLRDEERAGAGDHRAAGEAVPPDEARGVFGVGARAERAGARHRGERDPRDAQQFQGRVAAERDG